MLRIYRRHRLVCGHRSERYRRCQCPIHVEGSLDGEQVRKSLDLNSWEAASDLVAKWNASGQVGVVRIDPHVCGHARRLFARVQPIVLGTGRDNRRLKIAYSIASRQTRCPHQVLESLQCGNQNVYCIRSSDVADNSAHSGSTRWCRGATPPQEKPPMRGRPGRATRGLAWHVSVHSAATRQAPASVRRRVRACVVAGVCRY